ncbi:MAG TPA: excinuclease ABC subunit A, partial [Pirellulaceae bacterium]
MPSTDIVIKGAREHNLRDVDLVLPRNRLICFTGVSGSGKSSLAFDTLYAEGQRRYVESLSSYARQFLGQMPKPDVDFIGGLSPSISIAQKSAGNNPRSTVGTITEIHDFLRVLYARVGEGRCPDCGQPIAAQTRDQILARILSLPATSKILLLAPVIRGQKGEYKDLFQDLRKQGFARARVDGTVRALDQDLQLDRRLRHTIELVVDRLSLRGLARHRLAESVDLALKLGKGSLIVAPWDGPEAVAETDRDDEGRAQSQEMLFSLSYACSACGVSFEPPAPQLFSFNSPHGMCHHCDGLGTSFTFDAELLIPDASKSFRQGCVELVGPWKELSRWRRHILQGVAATIERLRNLPEDYLLDTPWAVLPEELHHIWLQGTGEQHITFTWRGGASPILYGGKFEGLVPEFLQRYRTAKSRALINKLEPYMRSMRCPSCQGSRLNRQARHVVLTSDNPRFAPQPERSLSGLCQLSIAETLAFLTSLRLDATGTIIGTELLKEIRSRLGFLINVGLEYLALDRTAPTLSGGESQRIRLASQVGSGLVGVLYILDEPSIGLHPRDNERLLDTL